MDRKRIQHPTQFSWINRIFVFGFTCLVALGLAQVAVKPVKAVEPVSFWQAKFDSIWSTEHNNYFLKWSKSYDSNDHYFVGYGVEGNLSMYQATGDKKYLDRALLYINNVIATAQPTTSLPNNKFPSGYLGWVNTTTQQPEVLRESVMFRYVAKTLRVIRSTPDLYNDSKYRSQYDSILAFTEKNIFYKWYNQSLGNIYRTNTHMASHWAFICLELSRITTNQDIKDKCTAVYQNMDSGSMPLQNSSFRNELIPNPNDPTAYFWNYNWNQDSRPGSDTAHGSHMISYLIEAHEQGSYWTTNDMQKFANMVKNVIWNQSLSNPVFSDNVDGSYDNHIYGYYVAELVKLGRFDPEVQEIFEHLDQPPGKGFYNTQFYGNGALNAKLLSSSAPAPTPTPVPTAEPTPLPTSLPSPSPSPSPSPTPSSSPSPTPTPSPPDPRIEACQQYDLNHDTQLNYDDLVLVQTNLLTSTQTDLNGDGTVNLYDLVLLRRFTPTDCTQVIGLRPLKEFMSWVLPRIMLNHLREPAT